MGPDAAAILDTLRCEDSFYLYGAQVVAYGAYRAIQALCGKTPERFLVTAPEGNPTEMDGIAAGVPEDACRDLPVVICVSSVLRTPIRAHLDALGFRRCLDWTDSAEFDLMSAFYGEKFPLLDRNASYPAADLALYEIRHHRDRPLQNPPPLHPWEHPIQAGAALTETRIADLTDCEGDQISRRNPDYSEMTAAYWVWKNAHSAWKGIEHYRRHLSVRSDQLGGGIDAVLPLPYLCYPDFSAQWGRFVSPEVPEAVLGALRVLYPAEADRYAAALAEPYQYPYNLVCARETVFDEYCAWLFSVTEYLETQKIPGLQKPRAMGYAAEALTGLYFLVHRDRLTLRHTAKEIFA